MWNSLVSGLGRNVTVEFGIHQLERIASCPMWRRHDNRSRFENLHNGLWGDKGAYANCTGTSPYAKKKSATGRLIVTSVAVWEYGAELGFLARSAIPHPEVTLVPCLSLESISIHAETEGELLAHLATAFGQGAEQYGVRWLTAREIVVPSNAP